MMKKTSVSILLLSVGILLNGVSAGSLVTKLPDLQFVSGKTKLTSSVNGKNYTITYQIKNGGNKDYFYNKTKPINVKCYDNDNKVINQYNSNITLKIGKTMFKSFIILKSKLQESLPIKCMIDKESKIKESNENNNAILIGLQKKVQDDLNAIDEDILESNLKITNYQKTIDDLNKSLDELGKAKERNIVISYVKSKKSIVEMDKKISELKSKYDIENTQRIAANLIAEENVIAEINKNLNDKKKVEDEYAIAKANYECYPTTCGLSLAGQRIKAELEREYQQDITFISHLIAEAQALLEKQRQDAMTTPTRAELALQATEIKKINDEKLKFEQNIASAFTGLTEKERTERQVLIDKEMEYQNLLGQ